MELTDVMVTEEEGSPEDPGITVLPSQKHAKHIKVLLGTMSVVPKIQPLPDQLMTGGVNKKILRVISDSNLVFIYFIHTNLVENVINIDTL